MSGKGNLRVLKKGKSRRQDTGRSTTQGGLRGVQVQVEVQRYLLRPKRSPAVNQPEGW